MLTSVASFVWASGPIMNAVFTILFLILIRIWSRSNSKITKPVEKIGEKLETAGKELADVASEAKDIVEGLADVESTKDSIKETCNQLDAQFFGELFIASLASGFLVKYIW